MSSPNRKSGPFSITVMLIGRNVVPTFTLTWHTHQTPSRLNVQGCEMCEQHADPFDAASWKSALSYSLYMSCVTNCTESLKRHWPHSNCSQDQPLCKHIEPGSCPNEHSWVQPQSDKGRGRQLSCSDRQVRAESCEQRWEVFNRRWGSPSPGDSGVSDLGFRA